MKIAALVSLVCLYYICAAVHLILWTSEFRQANREKGPLCMMAYFPDSFLKFILTFYWVMILDFEAIQASGSVFIQICVLDGLMFVNFQNMNADCYLPTC